MILRIVTLAGVSGSTGILEAASSYSSDKSFATRVEEILELSATVDGSGVRSRAQPGVAGAGPLKAGDGDSELFDSGVVNKNRARLGVGVGRSDDVSDSISLVLFP